MSVSTHANVACAVATDGFGTCITTSGGEGWKGIDALPGGSWQNISLGGGRACGVHADGAIECWGGIEDETWTPAEPPAGVFQSVDIRGSYACAVRSDGAVVCWDVWIPDDGGPGNSPAGKAFVQVDEWGPCAVTVEGGVVCWGDQAWAVDGAPSGTGWKQVACSLNNKCFAVNEDGSIFTWYEEGVVWPGEIAVPEGYRYSYVATEGQDSNKAITDDGALIVGWAGDPEYPNPFTLVGDPDDPWIQVSESTEIRCTLTRSGVIDCPGVEPGFGEPE